MRHRLALPHPLQAANVGSKDLVDAIVHAEMARQEIPGVSVAVVQNGVVMTEAGYGFANLEQETPATPDTVYQSGSVGKQFTAALILLLVRDGKLHLDDSLKKHLTTAPAAWRQITVRHLLTHTSGFGDPYDKLDLRRDYSKAQLLKIYATIPLRFAPGEKWSYSNMGYHVLGFLCDKVGGKFYGDQLQERIFAPLGMSTARIISEAEIIVHRAAGYQRIGDTIKNQEWVAPTFNMLGDGSLCVSVRDMAKWLTSLDGDVPLTASERQQSWTPVTLNNGKRVGYGFGWAIGTVNRHPVFSHSGEWQGFASHLAHYPDDKISVVVLTNLADTSPKTIADQIVASYVPALTPLPKKPIAPTPNILTFGR